ncbi:MAG: NAD(+) diphosphatase [Rhodoferax sp.]|nr:NAD(+) diphosphatase [Actinomycetota bacterium]
MTSASLPTLPLARSAIDRAAHRRTEDLLTALLAQPATRVLAVAAGRAAVSGDPVGLVLRAPEPADAGRLAVYLGTEPDGTEHVAVLVDDVPDGVGLREVGAVLGARDAGLLTQAVALLAWHAVHTHCPRCGGPTRVVQAGYSRHCDADGSDHYPRTDPAVIMTVVDTDDRLLLGHQASWPPGRFSTLAGFVEPGEPLEAAVRREVLEESGIVVGRVDYRGSQPWPFPASIMLGFHAYATSRDIEVDGVEIESARWFSREDLRAAMSSGEVLLPPSVSIARALIEDWFGGPLTDSGVPWA